MWLHQETWLLKKIGPNIGPLLLSFCCLTTSGMCLLTARLVKKFGYLRLIIAHYTILCLFLLIHLYPTIYLLLPAYVLLGITLGPSWICKFSLVVLFASRISCGQHECSTTAAMINESGGSSNDEHKIFCNRNERVRRLARWFHAIQDIGILLGALTASIIISCAVTESNCIFTQHISKLNRANDINNNTLIDKIQLNTLNNTHAGIDISHLSKANSLMSNKSKSIADRNEINDKITISSTIRSENDLKNAQTMTETTFSDSLNILKYYKESIFNQHDELVDSLFNTNEHGDRICGAGSCPTWNRYAFESNRTEAFNWFTFSGTITLTLIYFAFAMIALTFACLSQHVDNTFKYDNFKGITDTLLFASPMAYFIGTEQGYVIGGFTRVSLFLFYSFSISSNNNLFYENGFIFFDLYL